MGSARRAGAFLQANGRLLERQLFSALFCGADSAPARAALRCYQNPDGGFGRALVPELRGSHSSGAASVHALRVLDALDAFGDPCLEPALLYLADLAPSLEVSAAAVVLLSEHGMGHPWLEPASEFCWRALSIYADPPAGIEGAPPSFEALFPALEFLARAQPPDFLAPDPTSLHKEIETLVLEWDLVSFDPDAAGPSPLDWAPTPQSPGRLLFTDCQIELHLHALAARQLTDGGWPVPRPGPSPAATLERRGLATLDALRRLRAYGAL